MRYYAARIVECVLAVVKCYVFVGCATVTSMARRPLNRSISKLIKRG